mmetsp:Transcript_9821/g.39934  ORF Transcript_9821/g.39934 Transcript_9821/m.39934 type:complete len:221 (-) Transcript_9821:215-877(-)
MTLHSSESGSSRGSGLLITDQRKKEARALYARISRDDDDDDDDFFARMLEISRRELPTQKRPNQPLAASLRSALISASRASRFASASLTRCSLTASWFLKRLARMFFCSALDWTTRLTVRPERTSTARVTRDNPTPRVDHIWSPKVAEHMAMRSPFLTPPTASALPPLTTSLTKTSPLASWSRMRPSGLRMVTLRSVAPAWRASRSKSVSDLDRDAPNAL